MIKIKKNNYTRPTEVRERVVQDIVDAFLSPTAYHVCHMRSDPTCAAGRKRDAYVLKRKGETAYGFGDEPFVSDTDSVTYHETEMKEAFRVLIENGYYIFRVNTYGTWPGYVVRREDFCDNGVLVDNFSERWE